MSPVSPEEREQIVEALKAGGSIHGVAKTCGRAKGTVSAIAQTAGIERSAAIEKAVAARRDYCQAERQALLNEAFDKARELLPGCSTPGQFWQWTTAFSNLTTTRRLEDGDATSRAEVIGDNDTRARLAGRLDELANRRSAKDVAERAVG